MVRKNALLDARLKDANHVTVGENSRSLFQTRHHLHLNIMATPSSPSDNVTGTERTAWGFLTEPMVGNASLLAGFLHWLAIVFKWFLRVLLILLATGVMLGIASMIFSFLPPYTSRRSGESKTSANEDSSPSSDLVELDFLPADYDLEDSRSSDSDNEV